MDQGRSGRRTVGHGLKAALCFGGEARAEAATLGQEPERDAGAASGQAPVGQGALGAEPDRTAGVTGGSTVPMMVRFSWPVKALGDARASSGRPARPATSGAPAPRVKPEAVVDELGALHRQTEREAVAVDDGEVVGREPPTASCAAARHDAGGAIQAPGCRPLGAGSESGAAVPSGAFQVRGGSSRLRRDHHRMCSGVTSIQMRGVVPSQSAEHEAGLSLGGGGQLRPCCART